MALGIDGTPQQSTQTGTAASLTLSTALANDIIYLDIVYNGYTPPVSVSDTAGLTWIARVTDSSAGIFSYYAIAPSALSSDVITVIGTGAFMQVTAFAISGANTTTPFDSNGTIPGTSFGSAITISTTNANDILICGDRSGNGSPGAPSGFTSLLGANYQNTAYKIVSSAQSGLVVTPEASSNGAFVDVIVAAGGGPVYDSTQFFFGG